MISLWLRNDFRYLKGVGIATRDTFGYKAGLFPLWSHRFGFLCLAVKTLQCLHSAGSTTAAINELLWTCMAQSEFHCHTPSYAVAFRLRATWKPHGPTGRHRQGPEHWFLKAATKLHIFYLLVFYTLRDLKTIHKSPISGLIMYCWSDIQMHPHASTQTRLPWIFCGSSWFLVKR